MACFDTLNLKQSVKKSTALCPRHLYTSTDMSSGPNAFPLFSFIIAALFLLINPPTIIPSLSISWILSSLKYSFYFLNTLFSRWSISLLNHPKLLHILSSSINTSPFLLLQCLFLYHLSLCCTLCLPVLPVYFIHLLDYPTFCFLFSPWT